MIYRMKSRIIPPMPEEEELKILDPCTELGKKTIDASTKIKSVEALLSKGMDNWQYKSETLTN